MKRKKRNYERRLLSQRRVEIGQWLLDHPDQTIRQIAERFEICKTTVHKDLHRLEQINEEMYLSCMKILHKHVGGRYG